MEIIKEITGNSGAFKAIDNNEQAGEMTFSIAGSDKIIIDHTGVNDAYRGKGIGKIILEKVVEDARENNYKIIPLCPFAKAEMSKHPEYQDVLA